MGLPETIDFAGNFSVLVRVQGPDPKGLKMRNHAFHQYHSGKTTLSASGMFLPDTLYNTEVAKRIWDTNNGRNSMLVMTVASVIEPFLTIQHRKNLSQSLPELIPGAEIDIMVEENKGVDSDKGAYRWHTAWLLKMVDVPMSSLALQSLVQASSGSLENGWEFGWSLVSSTHQPEMNGSPFGILSPVHFFNSISVGSVANCYPPKSTDRALLMADIRCLPGMEGAPVFSDQNTLVGLLTRPLRQKNSDAEIQLVIPWEAIASACADLLLKEPQIAEKGININKGNLNTVGNGLLSNGNCSNGLCCYSHDHLNSLCPSLLPIEKVMTSICLITIDDGVWASGVVLNDQGLILTNAHLLEPWRFGKTTVRCGTNNEAPFLLPEGSASLEGEGFDRFQKSSVVPFPLADDQKGYKVNAPFHGHRRIRVRLDNLDPWIWCNAKVVYICKGPLDVALLQLDSIPDKLSPIMVDFNQPSLGSKAYIIGHGLLAPRCGFFPSVCSGVVSKVVKAEMPLYYKSFLPGVSQYPAMLETTAAVHPGGSGGAVVNSDGRLIGLVTRSALLHILVAFVVVATWMHNARHGGGKVIPHLNFSITSAVLMPIFQFARDMNDFSPLQHLDQPNEHLSSVWALMPPLSPKPGHQLNLPQPPLEGNDSKEEKGSRFAKFIAERNELLKGSSLFGKQERLPSQILRINDPTGIGPNSHVPLLQNPMGEASTKSSGYKEYVAGLLAGVATVVVGHPFDTVKVKLQKHNTEVGGIKYRNGLHCTARILSTEGVKGLYKGATSSFIGVAFEVRLFSAFIHKRKSFCGFVLVEIERGVWSSEPQPRVIIPSAAFGGAIISFVLCPSELVKCRMQVQGTDSSVPKSGSILVLSIVAGMFRGGTATLLRQSVGNAVFFSVYEYVRYYVHLRLNNDSLDPKNLTDIGIGILSGGLGGVAFWSPVLPLDVAKTIIQTSRIRALQRILSELIHGFIDMISKLEFRKYSLVAETMVSFVMLPEFSQILDLSQRNKWLNLKVAETVSCKTVSSGEVKFQYAMVVNVDESFWMLINHIALSTRKQPRFDSQRVQPSQQHRHHPQAGLLHMYPRLCLRLIPRGTVGHEGGDLSQESLLHPQGFKLGTPCLNDQSPFHSGQPSLPFSSLLPHQGVAPLIPYLLSSPYGSTETSPSSINTVGWPPRLGGHLHPDNHLDPSLGIKPTLLPLDALTRDSTVTWAPMRDQQRALVGVLVEHGQLMTRVFTRDARLQCFTWVHKYVGAEECSGVVLVGMGNRALSDRHGLLELGLGARMGKGASREAAGDRV
ncbi:Mitochondrial arginine transporter BAC1 [Hibiscus syriacus]|uniref:Mitochondrial arginine transporter BAC1 n=1 Tax=Hibiscus syriacus TaxID=106335 RepID=A0A6A3CN75_HIBSY|nr:Mitochondrial arginine transporter BAC1 [Hibiscus syriacus]